MFGIIVLLHNSSELELKDFLLQDFLIECRIHGKTYRSWSCKAAPDHHTTATMFDCWHDVLFMKLSFGFTPDVTGHAFQKVQILSHQSTEYLPKSLGDNQDIFWQMWGEPLCYFLSEVAFVFSLSYCWIVNTDFNWGKWGLQFFRCCSGFFYDLIDESTLRSWSNPEWSGRSLLGRFTTVPSFLYLWIMALTVVPRSPKNLEMAL